MLIGGGGQGIRTPATVLVTQSPAALACCFVHWEFHWTPAIAHGLWAERGRGRRTCLVLGAASGPAHVGRQPSRVGQVREAAATLARHHRHHRHQGPHDLRRRVLTVRPSRPPRPSRRSRRQRSRTTRGDGGDGSPAVATRSRGRDVAARGPGARGLAAARRARPPSDTPSAPRIPDSGRGCRLVSRPITRAAAKRGVWPASAGRRPRGLRPPRKTRAFWSVFCGT